MTRLPFLFITLIAKTLYFLSFICTIDKKAFALFALDGQSYADGYRPYILHEGEKWRQRSGESMQTATSLASFLFGDKCVIYLLSKKIQIFVQDRAWGMHIATGNTCADVIGRKNDFANSMVGHFLLITDWEKRKSQLRRRNMFNS